MKGRKLYTMPSTTAPRKVFASMSSLGKADGGEQVVEEAVALQQEHPGVGPQEEVHPHGQHDEHHGDAPQPAARSLAEHSRIPGIRSAGAISVAMMASWNERANTAGILVPMRAKFVQREVPGGGGEGIDHHHDEGRHHEDGHPSHIGDGEQ